VLLGYGCWPRNNLSGLSGSPPKQPLNLQGQSAETLGALGIKYLKFIGDWKFRYRKPPWESEKPSVMQKFEARIQIIVSATQSQRQIRKIKGQNFNSKCRVPVVVILIRRLRSK
jgi:hypothetical protein